MSAQIGGTLITWLLPWHGDATRTFGPCIVTAEIPFAERTVPTTLSTLLSHLLLSDRYSLALNASLFDHVLTALVHIVLRYGLSHVLLSLPLTWLLARGLRLPHSLTFCVVSVISFLGHLLLIVQAVFIVPQSVVEVTGVKQSPAQTSSPLMALVALFLYWAVLLLVCLWLVSRASTTRADKSRVTRVRKWYHVLSLAMFLPPLLLTTSHALDASHVLVIHALLLVAYPLVLGLGALVEYLRMHHLVFGDEISARFAPLLTNIDRAGPITYSHLALIGGLLGPVTLSHVLTDSLQLSLVSPRVTARVLTAGLLVLDVADTAASWFGSKYGNVLWSHVLSTRARLCAPLTPQRKSLEGSCAALLALVSVDHVLSSLVTCAWSTNHVLVPALLAVFTEAFTTQIDNLVLPAVYWTLLVATSP
jgi:dolichol kinase